LGQEIHDPLRINEHAVVMVAKGWKQPHPFQGKSVDV
jgi:hypothetical protein